MTTPSIMIDALRAVAATTPAQIAAVAALRRLIDRQADRIVELEQIVGLREEQPGAIRIMPLEQRLLGVLLKANGWRSATAIEALLWGHLPDADQPADMRRALRVHIHNLRRVLNPHGVRIETHATGSEVGYFISAASRARFAAVNAARGQD